MESQLILALLMPVKSNSTLTMMQNAVSSVRPALPGTCSSSSNIAAASDAFEFAVASPRRGYGSSNVMLFSQTWQSSCKHTAVFTSCVVGTVTDPTNYH